MITRKINYDGTFYISLPCYYNMDFLSGFLVPLLFERNLKFKSLKKLY